MGWRDLDSRPGLGRPENTACFRPLASTETSPQQGDTDVDSVTIGVIAMWRLAQAIPRLYPMVAACPVYPYSWRRQAMKKLATLACAVLATTFACSACIDYEPEYGDDYVEPIADVESPLVASECQPPAHVGDLCSSHGRLPAGVPWLCCPASRGRGLTCQPDTAGNGCAPDDEALAPPLEDPPASRCGRGAQTGDVCFLGAQPWFCCPSAIRTLECTPFSDAPPGCAQ